MQYYLREIINITTITLIATEKITSIIYHTLTNNTNNFNLNYHNNDN